MCINQNKENYYFFFFLDNYNYNFCKKGSFSKLILILDVNENEYVES